MEPVFARLDSAAEKSAGFSPALPGSQRGKAGKGPKGRIPCMQPGESCCVPKCAAPSPTKAEHPKQEQCLASDTGAQPLPPPTLAQISPGKDRRTTERPLGQVPPVQRQASLRGNDGTWKRQRCGVQWGRWPRTEAEPPGKPTPLPTSCPVMSSTAGSRTAGGAFAA